MGFLKRKEIIQFKVIRPQKYRALADANQLGMAKVEPLATIPLYCSEPKILVKNGKATCEEGAMLLKRKRENAEI